MDNRQVILITGAARGIGRATAELFAARGADLIIGDLAGSVAQAQTRTASAADLDETADRVRAAGANCLAVPIDVRDQSSLDAAVAAGLAEFGHLDVVVANAGIMHSQPFWRVDEAAWQAVLDINLSGVWRTAKAVAPHLIERRSGCFIAIGSVQARVARKGLAAYTASKHGVVGLVKNLALELGEFNVRVNAVLPGAVHTPMIDSDDAGRLDGGTDPQRAQARTAYFRGMSALAGTATLPPEAIASAVVWLASPEAAYVTGVELAVDAGSMVLPGLNFAAATGRDAGGPR